MPSLDLFTRRASNLTSALTVKAMDRNFLLLLAIRLETGDTCLGLKCMLHNTIKWVFPYA